MMDEFEVYLEEKFLMNNKRSTSGAIYMVFMEKIKEDLKIHLL